MLRCDFLLVFDGLTPAGTQILRSPGKSCPCGVLSFAFDDYSSRDEAAT